MTVSSPTQDAEVRVLFANDDWLVLADGLEHRGTGYFLARDALGARRRDDLWEWPMHLAEKAWCSPRLYREAFVEATERFGIARDADLARSFAVGFGMRLGSGRAAREGFVALADLVRPKSTARKRPATSEGSSLGRRSAMDRSLVSVGASA